MNSDETQKTDPGEDEPAVDEPNFVRGIQVLLLVFMASVALVGLVVLQIWGSPFAVVALLSGGVCAVSALIAHVLSVFPRGDYFLLIRLYQSSAVRIALPVAFLFVSKMAFEELFSKGMVYFVILFYLVGLMTDLKVQLQRLRMIRGSVNPAMGKPAGGETRVG